jgi:hypothetical protein
MTTERTLTPDEVDHLIRVGGTSLEGHAPCGFGVCCRMTRAVLDLLLALRGVPVATIDLSDEPVSLWLPGRRRWRKTT